MLELIQLFTVVLGIATTSLAVYLAYRFYRINHILSRALAFVLASEAAAGLITIIFSINSVIKMLCGFDPIWWDSMSPDYAVKFRLMLFLIAGITSVHLFNTLNKIVNGR